MLRWKHCRGVSTSPPSLELSCHLTDIPSSAPVSRSFFPKEIAWSIDHQTRFKICRFADAVGLGESFLPLGRIAGQNLSD